MREIDADAFKHYISQAMEKIEKTEDNASVVSTVKVIGETFMKIIDEVPTIPSSMREKCECNHDCDALYESYKKGYEDALKDVASGKCTS